MDLIERQAAIDAMTNALWHYPNECCRNLNEYEFAKGLAELGLKSVPSAQPGIIRCKDCKHRPFDGEDTQGFGVEFPDEKCPCQCEDGWYNWRPNNEWFCANAERRTDVKADKGASS